MTNDIETWRHKEWLGLLQPVGLVVSPPALIKAQAVVNRGKAVELQTRLTEIICYDPIPNLNSKEVLWIKDFAAFTEQVLEWMPEDLLGTMSGGALPQKLEVVLTDYGETLKPSYAVPDPDSDGWLMLVKEVAPGLDLDGVEPRLEKGSGWKATVQEKFERLLRETNIPIGILFNGTRLRLVYAPSGESSGHLTFPVQAMCEVSGRSILAALDMLLGQDRLFNVPTQRRLPKLLSDSREYQAEVSNKLANQVLDALWELLRGFQIADAGVNGKLLGEIARSEPQHIYGGLITTLMRLVFLLYAEDQGLMPGDDIYQRNYSVTGLYERLREDESSYPDTMNQRYGAWAWLLSLVRLVYDGGGSTEAYLPARHGQLFDPDEYPFLEGRSKNSHYSEFGWIEPPRIPDGVIYRVLQNLLVLDGERLSYRSLDVEQIGSVYEAIMGYEVEIARGTSIAVRPKDVVVNVDEILAAKPGDRAKILQDADCKVAGKVAIEIKTAKTPEEFVAALDRKVSARTSNLLLKGSLYLQPGEERRRTGSHYTPRKLTQPIVEKTLRPVLEGLGEHPTSEQILSLKICDLAMGSGAFLVETCRQLAEKLVEAWNRESELDGESNSGFDNEIHLVESNSGFENHTSAREWNSGLDSDIKAGESNSGFDSDIKTGESNSGFDSDIKTGESNLGFDSHPSAGESNSGFKNQSSAGESNSGFDSHPSAGESNSGFKNQSSAGEWNSGFDSHPSAGESNSGFDSQSSAGESNSGFDSHPSAGESNSPSKSKSPLKRTDNDQNITQNLFQSSSEDESYETGISNPWLPGTNNITQNLSQSSSEDLCYETGISNPWLNPWLQKTTDNISENSSQQNQSITNGDVEPILLARRLVAQRCLYGVDKNPFAVNLAKLSLWLVTLAKDYPFTFLDHALKCGDSLVGLTKAQIGSFGKDASYDLPLLTLLKEKIDKARNLRTQIQANDNRSDADYDQKRLRLLDVEQELREARLTGDVKIAAFFAGSNKKEREEKEREFAELVRKWRYQTTDVETQNLSSIQGISQKLRRSNQCIIPFNWDIEYPEVFDVGKSGFDAIVGNPPFAGKNTTISANAPGYLDWLKEVFPESHGNSDLVAFFFRRAFDLLREGGAFGLIATNTIAQGDTRSTGLRWICQHGGTIYHAQKRMKWVGQAAVVVSVVNVLKGIYPGIKILDGREVDLISAFLFHAGGNENPQVLLENANKSFIGSYVLGMGFTFDDSKPEATSIEEMHRLIEKDAKNAERIFPYIGGEEVNSSPTHAHHRYVINFGEMSEDEAREYSDLMGIVEEKVKPERDKLGNNADAKRRKNNWWLWGRYTSGLFKAIAPLERVLVNSQVSTHLAFAFLPSNWVYAHYINVFAETRYSFFYIMQSRVHEIWARFFCSTLGDGLRYTPSDGFQTFPFPENWETNPKLEAAGKEYYEYRAELMVRNNQGLTETYNRFHNPEENHPEIIKLRELHTQMDKAVLEAYGWTDIPTECEFLLDYEDEDDNFTPNQTEGGRKQKKKPYRYRWNEETHDDVLARLLVLNKERAIAEELGGKEKGKGKKKAGKGKGKKTGKGKEKKDEPMIAGFDEVME
ncbi:Eco57I restriction-modification methylase domain-containing protein [Plectonema radiosum]|uniref:Eco57I restriction-modification methylase domain-containing protein n=1 Tax=Plectonema radiosum TaxID=945768 RepID=UPI001D154974|nr:DNA methyltransferase [Plectonema radiosum]